MTLKYKILVPLIMLGTISVASAQSTGFYIGGQVGASFLQNRNLEKDWYSAAPMHMDFSSLNQTVFAGGINVGYNFKPLFDLPFRTELSLIYRGDLNKNTNEQDVYNFTQKTKTRMNTLMLNGYYDIYTNSAITPYVTAGVGISMAKLEGTMSATGLGSETTLSKSDTNFAWNVGAGLNYTIFSDINIDVGARYVDGGKIKASYDAGHYTTTTKAELSSIDLLLGVSYNF